MTVCVNVQKERPAEVDVAFNGRGKASINVVRLPLYVVPNSVSKVTYDSLVDRGANGGLSGLIWRVVTS